MPDHGPPAPAGQVSRREEVAGAVARHLAPEGSSSKGAPPRRLQTTTTLESEPLIPNDGAAPERARPQAAIVVGTRRSVVRATARHHEHVRRPSPSRPPEGSDPVLWMLRSRWAQHRGGIGRTSFRSAARRPAGARSRKQRRQHGQDLGRDTPIRHRANPAFAPRHRRCEPQNSAPPCGEPDPRNPSGPAVTDRSKQAGYMTAPRPCADPAKSPCHTGAVHT